MTSLLFHTLLQQHAPHLLPSPKAGESDAASSLTRVDHEGERYGGGVTFKICDNSGCNTYFDTRRDYYQEHMERGRERARQHPDGYNGRRYRDDEELQEDRWRRREREERGGRY